MQLVLAYLAYVTVFQLLSGTATQPHSPEKPKLPDQAKLQGYLEHYEKALGNSWLIKSDYDAAMRCSMLDSEEKRTGQVTILRLPGMPEVFWQSESMANSKKAFFRLHIGQCRFTYCHWAIEKLLVEVGSPTARLASFEWKREKRFWVDNAAHLWVNGSVGPYDYFFDNGNASFHKHFYLGSLDDLVNRIYVAIQSRGPVGLLLGLEAKQAQERFDIKMTRDDENYIYLEVLPKNKDDKADFARAQVVIDKKTFLPRRLWYADRDRDTQTYNFTQMIAKP